MVGICLLELGEYPRALPLLQEAAATLTTVGNLEDLAQVEETLGMCYFKLGQLEEVRACGMAPTPRGQSTAAGWSRREGLLRDM
jgi:tetratricopeptide (TPR) repeat protein